MPNIKMEKTKIKILTSFPGKPGKFWGDHTELTSEKCREINCCSKNKFSLHLNALITAIDMLRKHKDFDVVVLEGGPIGEWFAWLQALSFYKKRPALMIDCLWYKNNNILIRMIKKTLLRLLAKSVDRFVVWARHEIEDYSNEFCIQKEKFIYIPFHNTLDGYSFDIVDGNFIFSGGNGDRDYKTLIDAVRNLDMPIFIAASNGKLFRDISIPDNVTIQSLSHEEFRKKMGACRIAVLPMQGGLLHSGGQQTFLNSMAMGKATIVVGPKAADGYMKNEENGLVVDYKDVDGLRSAIIKLWNDVNFRIKLGNAAKEFAAKMTTDKFVRNIYCLAGSLLSDDKVN